MLCLGSEWMTCRNNMFSVLARALSSIQPGVQLEAFGTTSCYRLFTLNE